MWVPWNAPGFEHLRLESPAIAFENVNDYYSYSLPTQTLQKMGECEGEIENPRHLGVG
jgi:hypothetical protein